MQIGGARPCPTVSITKTAIEEKRLEVIQITTDYKLDEEPTMGLWQIIFLRSKVNDARYDGDHLLTSN
jgi:hypothetical protein